MVAQDSIIKKPWFLFQIIINSFLILFQCMVFVSDRIFLIYNDWFIVMSRILLGVNSLVFLFCCYLAFRILINKKIYLTFVLIQCIGFLVSTVNYRQLLFVLLESHYAVKFMLLPYLIFTFVSFSLAHIFVKMKPNWTSRFQAYTLKRKLKIKLGFDLDSYEYIKAQSEKKNKTVKHFLQDIIYQSTTLHSCEK